MPTGRLRAVPLISLSVRNSVRSLLLLLLPLLIIVACGEKELTPEEKAKASVRESYEHLLAYRYDQFVGGCAGADSLSPDYREQLVTACKQFMAQQVQAHGAILSFQIGNARLDSTLQHMEVFVVLNYTDGMEEEIVVPMVEHNGRWMMK